MNSTFKIDGAYDLEITSDGTLSTRGANQASGAYCKGHIGVMLHHTNLFPQRADGSPALDGSAPEVTTPVAIYLKRNQARAIASALLSAVSEASE